MNREVQRSIGALLFSVSRPTASLRHPRLRRRRARTHGPARPLPIIVFVYQTAAGTGCNRDSMKLCYAHNKRYTRKPE